MVGLGAGPRTPVRPPPVSLGTPTDVTPVSTPEPPVMVGSIACLQPRSLYLAGVSSASVSSSHDLRIRLLPSMAGPSLISGGVTEQMYFVFGQA